WCSCVYWLCACCCDYVFLFFFFFFQAEDGIRDFHVTGVQTCALPISTVWLRVGKTFVMQAVFSPFSAMPNVARKPAPPAPTTTKIGRASCRERGEVAVVAGAGKKKRKSEETSKEMKKANDVPYGLHNA